MSLKIEKIKEDLKNLTIIEAVTLIQELEKLFGINIASLGQQFVMPVSKKDEIVESVGAVDVEEKNTFDIVLSEVPADKKIAILKVIRNATGLGLKESKEIVDNVPKLIKESIQKEEVEALKKEFEAVGAKVIIK